MSRVEMRGSNTFKWMLIGVVTFGAAMVFTALRTANAAPPASGWVPSSASASASSAPLRVQGEVEVRFSSPTPELAASGTSAARPVPTAPRPPPTGWGDTCPPAPEIRSAIIGHVRGTDKNGNGFLEQAEISGWSLALSGSYCVREGDCLQWPAKTVIEAARIPLSPSALQSGTIAELTIKNAQPPSSARSCMYEVAAVRLEQCRKPSGRDAVECRWSYETRETAACSGLVRAQECSRGWYVTYSELAPGRATPSALIAPTGTGSAGVTR